MNDRLRVFPPPQSSNSATCLRVAAAVAALVLDFAFVAAPALAHSVAFGLGTKSCVCLVDYLGFHSSRSVVDPGFSRLSGWRTDPLVHLIAAAVAHSNFRSCLAVSDHGSCRQIRLTIALRLNWIAVAVVAGFGVRNCQTASDRGFSRHSVWMIPHLLLLRSIAAVAMVDSDSAPSL